MSTDWYYAVEGNSHGPVSAQEFEELIAVGTIRGDTLVWQEGMDDWLPYRRANTGTGAMPPPDRMPSSNASDPARGDANTFPGALKDGLARYVDFKTRSTRSQFWWWVLWSIIFSIGSAMIDSAIGAGDSGPVGLLVSLALFLPSLAVAIRRLHDIGRTGWWYLLVFIPIVGWIVLIVFYCTKTEETPNQWGMPPNR
ncbi:DUF805 domain-containing protein [uncultured Sulfitobacter sp.]|uniref:DUF805 domain-containing protein n=1 Tax=uncultured Sulfitobacter sp. TaxID=191468 RepID=UPI0026234B23|nr:DUF805 domain-containing protein [uncultured Sulfitobacter sp.]